MGTVLNSLDNMHASAQQYGVLSRIIWDNLTSVTPANSTSGYTSTIRAPRTFTVPTLSSGLSGAYLVNSRMLLGAGNANLLICLETTLGTLTITGNSFSAGSSMPVKTNPGDRTSTIQTASEIFVVAVTTSCIATNPVLTITYTDQDGNTGQTATLTLPSNAVANSAYIVSPHFSSGDTGVRAVTNMSISTGSAGVIKAYGALILAQSSARGTGLNNGPSPLLVPNLLWKLSAGDIIALYQSGSSTGGGLAWYFTLLGDN